MTYQTSNGKNIEYEIVRKKNKNVYFRFKEDLKLYISAPLYLSAKSIEKLIRENEIEILKLYEKALDKSKDIERFCYLGKKYFIQIDEACEKITFQDDTVIAPSMKSLEELTKKSILKIYGQEIDTLKGCFSTLPEFTWKTRFMRTRWGVCNTKTKVITLNTELIKKDIELLDYVIIHEMCHFFEANHSKDFWQLVSLACPRYKELRKKLKE